MSKHSPEPGKLYVPIFHASTFTPKNHNVYFGISQICMLIWLYGIVVKIFETHDLPYLKTYFMSTKVLLASQAFLTQQFFSWGNLPFLHFGREKEVGNYFLGITQIQKQVKAHDSQRVFLLATFFSLILVWALIPYFFNALG